MGARDGSAKEPCRRDYTVQETQVNARKDAFAVLCEGVIYQSKDWRKVMDQASLARLGQGRKRVLVFCYPENAHHDVIDLWCALVGKIKGSKVVASPLCLVSDTVVDL
jgi:hypothetical protein